MGAAYIDIIFTQVSHLELFNFAFFIITIIFGVIMGFSIGSINEMWFKKTPQSKENNVSSEIYNRKQQ